MAGLSPDIPQIGLLAAGAYCIFKSATAPWRGRFLTAFGYVAKETRPRTFRLCVASGYVIAAVLLLAAIYPRLWMPLVWDLEAAYHTRG